MRRHIPDERDQLVRLFEMLLRRIVDSQAALIEEAVADITVSSLLARIMRERRGEVRIGTARN